MFATKLKSGKGISRFHLLGNLLEIVWSYVFATLIHHRFGVPNDAKKSNQKLMARDTIAFKKMRKTKFKCE